MPVHGKQSSSLLAQLPFFIWVITLQLCKNCCRSSAGSSTTQAVICGGEVGSRRSHWPCLHWTQLKGISFWNLMHLQKLSFNWSPRLIPTCRSPLQAYSHPSPTYLSSASFPSPFLGTTKFSRGLIHASSLRPCNSTIFPQCSCPWNTEQCASPATQETSSVEECLFLADTHNLYEEVFFISHSLWLQRKIQ